VPPSQTITLTINNPGAVNSSAYTIQKVFGNAFVNIFPNNTAQFSLGNYSQSNPQQGTITLHTTVNASCGDITQAYNFTTQGQCTDCMTSYTVSPNPASGRVRVSGTASDGKGTKAVSIYRVSIYNSEGTLLKAYNFGGVPEASLDVSEIKTGVYVLKIFDGISETSERLIVR
jgi:hypothetical protein